MYERRQISKKEKAILYNQSKGKCNLCNEQLGYIWHVHHIQRYADGGKSHLFNSMALCVECHKFYHHNNLKGNIMTKIKPREWQSQALNNFIGKCMEKDKPFFLLEATPGAGKTHYSAMCAKYLIEQQQANFVIAVVPNLAIKESFTNAFHQHKIELHSEFDSKNGYVPKSFSGIILTYQSLHKFTEHFITWTKHNNTKLFFIFDEIHHTCVDNDGLMNSVGNTWGETISICSQTASAILGMTGTPFRSDGNQIPFVEYDSNGKCIADYVYNYSRGVADNVCREIKFAYADGDVEYTCNGEYNKDIISECNCDNKSIVKSIIFNKNSKWLKSILLKANEQLEKDRLLDGRSAGLIICLPAKQGDEDKPINEIAELIENILDEKPIKITSNDDYETTKAILKSFKNDVNKKWIISVRKITEGVDIPRLKVCVLASEPTTELLFRQIIGRVVRVEKPEPLETATVFMPKFDNLVSMANQVMEEAAIGLQDNKQPIFEPGDDTNEPDGHWDKFDNDVNNFTVIDTSYKNGGYGSIYKDYFEPEEINYAELMQKSYPDLRYIPVLHIAKMNRVNKIQIETKEEDDRTLGDIIKDLRGEINSLFKIYVQKTMLHDNIDSNDRDKIKDYHIMLRKKLYNKYRVKDIDDLCDNRGIEYIKEVIQYLKLEIANI